MGMIGDMGMNDFRDEQLTERIIGCVIHVHKTLGPGFLESVYKSAVLVELRKQNLSTEVEKEIVVYYDRLEVGRHRLDLLVEGRIILELKTVEAFSKAHYAQVRAYLKATGLQTALLINFSDFRADFRRIEAQ
jgi:GxxExxY protein